MILIILICHLGGCDRIERPVDNCIMSGMTAQIILAQSHLAHNGDNIKITCGPEK